MKHIYNDWIKPISEWGIYCLFSGVMILVIAFGMGLWAKLLWKFLQFGWYLF